MENEPASLKESQIDDFIQKGYFKINNAFSENLAESCSKILWKDTGCSKDDP